MHFPVIALLALLSLGQAAWAHHSRANFQLDNLVEKAGVITDVSWSNPHIYWEMELDNGENWTIEGHSVPGALRNGWTRETLNVGDVIRVGVFPDQKPDRRFALVEWIVPADGVALAGFNPRSIPAELRNGAPPRRPQGAAGPSQTAVAPSTDMSGTWRADLRGVNLRTGVFDPATNLPLTAEGEAVMAEYDDADNPEYQCEKAALPLGGPYLVRFERFADRFVIQKEHGGGDGRYVVWLDRDSMPENQPADRTGLAFGAFDDNVLNFQIDNFAPSVWGVSRGLDSSVQKQVAGTFELSQDGRSITYSYEISDPVYLTEPIERSGTLLKQPDTEFVNEECDPAISSLHLTLE